MGLGFTGMYQGRPEQIRNLLINDVRDGYAAIYDDVSIILAPSRGQSEKLLREPSRMPMMTKMTVLAFVVVAAILGYHYSLYEGLIRDLQDQMRHFLAR